MDTRVAVLACALAACGGGRPASLPPPQTLSDDAGADDAGPDAAVDAGSDDAGLADAGAADAGDAADAGADAGVAAPHVDHLVILLQENHTFDSYFGLYCSGGATPAPGCVGRACCERAPQNVPGLDSTTLVPTTCHGYAPGSYLDDAYNNAGDPTHKANYEYDEMHWSGATGAALGHFSMDRYLCHNVEYAFFDEAAAFPAYPVVPASDTTYPLRTYHSLAQSGALADRYFQPIVGASCSNDMFFARGGFVYQDNQRDLPFAGYTDATVGDLLDAKGVPWAVYMEGLTAGCASGQSYPDCVDLTDDPFSFSARYQNQARVLRDLSAFYSDLSGGSLPAVSLLRALGVNSEHPESGSGGDITAGENKFIKPVVDAINASPYAGSTLILITWDEGGGWFDHVTPPAWFADGCEMPSTPVDGAGKGACGLVDASHLADGTRLPQTTSDPEYFSNSSEMAGQEYYGTRLGLLALGPFARKGQGGHISHVEMEHSSIVKFIEWNWLGHASGQLGAREPHVNNIGSMLDPALGVPEGVGDF